MIPPHLHRDLVKWSELGNTLKIVGDSYEFFLRRGILKDIPMLKDGLLSPELRLGMAQEWSVCLICIRPWLQSPFNLPHPLERKKMTLN